MPTDQLFGNYAIFPPHIRFAFGDLFHPPMFRCIQRRAYLLMENACGGDHSMSALLELD